MTAFNPGTEEMKKGCQRRQVGKSWMWVPSRTEAGTPVRERRKLCLLHLGVERHSKIGSVALSTFAGGSLQTSSGLLPGTEPLSAAGVHLGCSQGTFSSFVSSQSKPGFILWDSYVNRGEVGNLPWKHFPDWNENVNVCSRSLYLKIRNLSRLNDSLPSRV